MYNIKEVLDNISPLITKLTRQSKYWLNGYVTTDDVRGEISLSIWRALKKKNLTSKESTRDATRLAVVVAKNTVKDMAKRYRAAKRYEGEMVFSCSERLNSIPGHYRVSERIEAADFIRKLESVIEEESDSCLMLFRAIIRQIENADTTNLYEHKSRDILSDSALGRAIGVDRRKVAYMRRKIKHIASTVK